jgi:hypothetical protein
MQWARERAPADDWAYLPWEGTVAGASGNQLFAVAKVADGGVASVRVLGDGEIEVACDGTVHRVDGAGRTIARREHPRSSPWPARAVRVAAATAFAAAVPLEARPARAAVVLGVVLWLSTAFLDRGGDALPPDGGWTRIRTDEPGD